MVLESHGEDLLEIGKRYLTMIESGLTFLIPPKSISPCFESGFEAQYVDGLALIRNLHMYWINDLGNG